ncbi:MAG: SHOCT domain-containing protein [Candidatus Abyssobacteria bacterium SURF_5]|uniref:SHOCT domain-containing protein n=1 Tax=Abyssobacteria bacterium (strain SURF_5) TaxID=2093360 RepID=A0A3A4N1R4_ABYX5|nr:MAG: SHOCT domain-containing protein [Candidatus Abyssubacteria bacterium SURF_5]
MKFPVRFLLNTFLVGEAEREESGMRAGRILTSILLISLLSGCHARDYWGHMDDRGHGMMDYWYGGILMWIVVLLILGIAVYFIVVAARSGRREAPPTRREETPLEILRVRYAKGEITKEQFEAMKRDLQE